MSSIEIEVGHDRFEKVKEYYDVNCWSDVMVWNSVDRWITTDEFKKITGQVYEKKE